MKNYSLYLLLLCLVALASCSPKGPYALTNKVYNNKTKGFVATIQKQLPDSLRDSTGMLVPSAWVGTVNFGIRRPNFVIIHFTGQDSVQQTLKTFTSTRTQVRAH
jgi:N-acetylmuramoyl-L-alanine amidase